MWSSPRIYIGRLLFLLYVNDIPQIAYIETIQVLFYQYKNVTEIENALSKEFKNVYGWFVDNKLSIHCGKNKNKSFFKLTN